MRWSTVWTLDIYFLLLWCSRMDWQPINRSREQSSTSRKWSCALLYACRCVLPSTSAKVIFWLTTITCSSTMKRQSRKHKTQWLCLRYWWELIWSLRAFTCIGLMMCRQVCWIQPSIDSRLKVVSLCWCSHWWQWCWWHSLSRIGHWHSWVIMEW